MLSNYMAGGQKEVYPLFGQGELEVVRHAINSAVCRRIAVFLRIAKEHRVAGRLTAMLDIIRLFHLERESHLAAHVVALPGGVGFPF